MSGDCFSKAELGLNYICCNFRCKAFCGRLLFYSLTILLKDYIIWLVHWLFFNWFLCLKTSLLDTGILVTSVDHPFHSYAVNILAWFRLVYNSQSAAFLSNFSTKQNLSGALSETTNQSELSSDWLKTGWMRIYFCTTTTDALVSWKYYILNCILIFYVYSYAK